MKLLYRGLAAGLLLLSSACYKDQGNYDYQDREEITITGIAASYDKISLSDHITIDPVVTSTDPKADFVYYWGIYETNVQGSAPRVDTIARAKAIDYLVVQPAKAWVLVFGAKNKHTGVTKIVTSTVNVVTQFTRGWYVMKDDGSKTDVDLFLTPANIAPESKVENVFSLVNGKKLDGKAALYGFYNNYKSTVTGALANTRALFILSDKDASVVNINTFKEIRDFSNLFYETPAVKQPAIICEASQANYIVNNGNVHGIYSMSSNVGQFGGVQMRDDVNSPYKLSKYFITTPNGNPFFFDETSSSFVSTTGSSNVMSNVTDQAGTAMPANKNNKTVLFMGVKASSPFSGVAIFQDKTDPALRILSQVTPTNYALKLVNDTIAASAKIMLAEKYALIFADENIIYFSVGNEVWSRNITNGAERLQFTVPAGEEITFIRHRKYAGSATAELPYYFNFMMIGTKAGTNYKVRMFQKASGNLATTPDFTLEGAGSVGDVIYIAPAIANSTFPNTY